MGRITDSYAHAAHSAVSRGQDFGQMKASHSGVLAAERAADMHQARIVDRCAYLPPAYSRTP